LGTLAHEERTPLQVSAISLFFSPKRKRSTQYPSCRRKQYICCRRDTTFQSVGVSIEISLEISSLFYIDYRCYQKIQYYSLGTKFSIQYSMQYYYIILLKTNLFLFCIAVHYSSKSHLRGRCGASLYTTDVIINDCIARIAC